MSATATKEKKKIVLTALVKKACNITEACKAAGISRRIFYYWKNDDKMFAEKVAEIEESMVDLAESSLLLKVKQGNMTAIIFYLTNRAPDRWKHKSEQVQKVEFEGDLNVSDKFQKHAEQIADRFNLPL